MILLIKCIKCFNKPNSAFSSHRDANEGSLHSRTDSVNAPDTCEVSEQDGENSAVIHLNLQINLQGNQNDQLADPWENTETRGTQVLPSSPTSVVDDPQTTPCIHFSADIKRSQFIPMVTRQTEISTMCEGNASNMFKSVYDPANQVVNELMEIGEVKWLTNASGSHFSMTKAVRTERDHAGINSVAVMPAAQNWTDTSSVLLSQVAHQPDEVERSLIAGRVGGSANRMTSQVKAIQAALPMANYVVGPSAAMFLESDMGVNQHASILATESVVAHAIHPKLPNNQT